MEEELKEYDLEKFESILEEESREDLQRYFQELPAGERARLMSRLDEEEQQSTLKLLGPEESASMLEHFGEAQAVEILENLESSHAAEIVDNLHSDTQADLLAEVDDDFAEEILRAMSPEEAEDARELMRFDWDTAGGMMVTEYLRFPEAFTITQVIDDMRRNRDEYAGYNIQYAYIVDDAERLRGVLRLRDLLLARPNDRVQTLMIANPKQVAAETSLHDLYQLFHESSFVGLPVTDQSGALVGVVTRAAVEEAMSEEATENFLKVSGLQGTEELRSMPFMLRARRRLSWLSINIVLNVLAASVIALNQDVLSSVIALAVFLPIISDMSGCSGNQAVGVSIRELTLGLIRPTEFLRVFLKESSIGVFNGLVLGALTGIVGGIWQSNWVFGLVVGSALMLNTLLAVCLGGLIPLALKTLKMDPALASAPILTTLTDMCGFFFVLTFASLAMPALT